MIRLPPPTPFRIVAGLVVAACMYWLFDGGHRRFLPRNGGVVVENRIYRSGQVHRRLIAESLQDLKIDVVVDMAPDKPGDRDEAAERAILERLGIERVAAKTLDGYGRGDVEDYVGALEAIVKADEANRRVWVHCAAGSERCGAVVAWYRMLFQGWDGPEAFDEYRTYRKRPPNDGILPKYMAEHHTALVQGLEARGIAVPHAAPTKPFGPRE